MKSPYHQSIAGPHEGGDDGDVELEWARCTALDLKSTKIYASTTEFSDVLGLSPITELPPTEGNTTIIQLNPLSLIHI